MTKRTSHDRVQRAMQNERTKEIAQAWWQSVPAAEAQAFAVKVEAARSRPPVVHEDMAPGTPPNPPHPGREPRQKKDEQRPRRY